MAWAVSRLDQINASGCRTLFSGASEPPTTFDRTERIRNDDREEVISGRLAAYETQTRLVTDYYRAQRRLVAINADRPVEEVTAQIFGVIDSHGNDSHCPVDANRGTTTQS